MCDRGGIQLSVIPEPMISDNLFSSQHSTSKKTLEKLLLVFSSNPRRQLILVQPNQVPNLRPITVAIEMGPIKRWQPI
jgi:hypothetical protein